MSNIYHIYDKMFKKILTLSSTAVVNLINGLFDTNYPTDSSITYHWTEFENNELKRILADTILTINGQCSYHMEAQMTEDEDIIFRVFEYGYRHAERDRHYGVHMSTDAKKTSDTETIKNGCTLRFPEPKIIYLSSSDQTPDAYTLHLDFGTQGSFLYKVSAFKLLDTSTEELNQKKMIILIPFLLLKLRKIMEKERSKENLTALKTLIQNDIIASIENNLDAGNITLEDARLLRDLTRKLYRYIYAHYDEMEEITEMTDQSILLDIEIAEMNIEKRLTKQLTEQLTKQLTEQLTEQLTKQLTEQLTEQFKADLAKKDIEIAALKSQLTTLTGN